MEESITGDLVKLAIYGIVGAAIALFTIWRIIKMQKAAKAPISDNECVFCGSKNVTKLSDGVYLCKACGYEGGSGIARAQAEQQQASIDAMSPEDRRTSGTQDLHQARNLLSSVLTGLDAAAPGAFSVESARTEIVQAEHCLRQAAMKLGDRAVAPPQEPDDTEQLAVATASDALGGAAARMASAAQSPGMRKKARSLLGMAEEALKRHQAVS